MISPKSCSWQRVAPSLAALSVSIVGVCAWPYTVDDAYIVARYARNLATFAGYSLDGRTPSDGVTGPLWLLPGMAASWLGGDPVVGAKLLGLAAMVTSVWLVLRRLGGRAGGRRLLAVAVLLVVCQPTAGCWGVAGLETGAATLALCVAWLAATRRPHPDGLATGLGLAALAWLRPELGVSAALLLVSLALRHPRQARPAVWLASLGLGSVSLFRRLLFGAWLPLSYYAKLGTPAQGLQHALGAALVLAGLFGLVLPIAAWLRGRSDDRSAALLLAGQVVAVVFAGGDWMPGFRLFAPLLPIYVSLCAVGAVRLARSQLGAVVALLCLLFACAVPATDLLTRMPDLRAAGAGRERVGRALALQLQKAAHRVALVDIGYLGYISTLQVVDLAGITDPEIARLPGGHLDKHVSDALLARRAPDAVVLHASRPPRIDASGRLLSLAGYPVEQRVAAGAWLQTHFRVARVLHYAPHYEYVLLLPVAEASAAPGNDR
ncbi:MAG TPA: hypothetical protein VF331_10915 [Polyangiales bacterium]